MSGLICGGNLEHEAGYWSIIRPNRNIESRADRLKGVREVWSEDITDYDRDHFVTYVRLLDAMEAGASEEEICRVVLGIDSAKEPERANRALLSHVRRARWMTEHGYRRLLQQSLSPKNTKNPLHTITGRASTGHTPEM